MFVFRFEFCVLNQFVRCMYHTQCSPHTDAANSQRADVAYVAIRLAPALTHKWVSQICFGYLAAAIVFPRRLALCVAPPFMAKLHEDTIAKELTGIVGVPWSTWSMVYKYVDTYKLVS